MVSGEWWAVGVSSELSLESEGEALGDVPTRALYAAGFSHIGLRGRGQV